APMPQVAPKLSIRQLATLERQVAEPRAADPRSFSLVTRLVQLAPEMHERARGRRAPVSLHLAKLGPKALMPSLEILALEPARGKVPLVSVRRDVIEAVGLLRDPRALPILFAIIDDEDEDAETTRTATEAIARIGTEEAATKILSVLDSARGERARAVVAGMGECRRLRVAEALAERLRTTTDEATVLAAARALGRAGNAWAWKTLSDRHEEAKIRSIAARALVDAFVRYEGEARAAAANALLVVDAPETLVLIAEASSSASPQASEALQALRARVERNPAR
ncbi:MAG TPA: HEAT repeat domain-containing protein, partial [Labilithrix sp.]|nr:HEAT repeat domain-containing protein [Labilithrix sp.]